MVLEETYCVRTDAKPVKKGCDICVLTKQTEKLERGEL